MGIRQSATSSFAGGGPGPSWRQQMRWWSLTKWLIAINVAVFVLQMLSRGWVTDALEFSAAAGIYHVQLWRWLSCHFLHANGWHLLMNMWALSVFGPPVEVRLGKPRYFLFYMLCGLGGVLGYLLLWRLNILETTRETTMVGASACIIGCLVGSAHLVPKRTIRFVFPPVALTIKTIAWIYVGLAVLNIASKGENSGGEAAHLGGAAIGFVLVRNLNWLSALPIGQRKNRFWKPGDPTTPFFREDA